MKSLNFLSILRRETRQFAVIGLGRFGRSVCRNLHKLGYEVLGTDIKESLVSQVLTENIASSAIKLDSTKPNALKEAGIFEFDTVIIAIGNYLEESIVTALNIKEGGVKYVIAKASSDVHGKLLQKVGADLVVYPEYQAGCDLVHLLTQNPRIIERFELDPDHSIVETRIPQEFHGIAIEELKLRSRYDISVLAVGNDDKFKINPSPQEKLNKNLSMVVIGSNKAIQKLPL
ncbi:potassium channel family protein [Candidatus Atelocyanobacterium thalassae]|uniref:K+ transport system, NAD-binding component n=1 Tax=Atelocyanobacterium thalassa (isolate ALOHA) TaxID=1453429 RepID=D3EQR0_ATETH|nr:TrkA family potassium uptake protein [Candidatus Atelocyanobacterium thalassa]ADB95810.1 K+ transport system, NAD-binding component [Candidatus Atelocyanobacterium thalassa isolate ALOHA]